MDANPVIDMLGRRLRLGVIGPLARPSQETNHASAP